MTAEPLEQPEPWPAVMARQAGVLSRQQALRGGLSAEAWDWRLARRWHAPAPGVAVEHRGRPSAEQLAWCAVLLGGHGACLTGWWALAAHGLQQADLGPVHLLVPAERRVQPRLLDGRLRVVPHRTQDLSVLRHPVRQPPSARVPVAAVQAAAWTPSPRAGEAVLAMAVQRHLTTAGALRDVLLAGRLPRRRALLAVLDDVELGAHAQTELDLLRFLRRHRLPRPDRLQLQQRDRRTRYLDAWWERQRVVVEVDGAHHRLVGQWEADLLRANAVQVRARGDRVLLLRLTGGQLRSDAPEVLEHLRAALQG